MSGNPFRTSPAPKHPPAAPLPTTFRTTNTSSGVGAHYERESDAGLSAAPAPPVKTKKSVRIESPTETIPPHPAFYNEDDSPLSRTSYTQHTSPPPPVSSEGFTNDFQHIEGGAYGRSGGSNVHGIAGGSRSNPDSPAVVLSPSSAPANPFAKTLATIEPRERENGELVENSKDRSAAERPLLGTTKPSLDVEGFKNMLMSGITSPRSSGPAPVPQAAPSLNLPNLPTLESSSGTDTSSVSRQSLFEPVHEPHPETPRTSDDMIASDDESTSLMGEIKGEKKKPPPAPRHRHGKLVSSRTPQTVSFEDFKPMDATPSPPTMRRQNSDMNKPLPPTPPVFSPPSHIVSQDITHDTPSISDVKTGQLASQPDVAVVHKKAPPPVPLARRHSQLRSSTQGNRSRSNSSLTMSSQHSGDFPITSPAIDETGLSPPTQKAPPPPPPSRHRGAALSMSTSSANSSSTELSATAAARRPTLSSPTPPPPRRTNLASDPPSPAGLVRTSSMSSTRNTQRTVSNESSNSVNMPPPPPPPRKRTSGSRSSFDKERPILPPTSPVEHRRTSTEHKRNSIDSKRRTSVASESSLRYEYPQAAADVPVLHSPREEEGEKSAEFPVSRETDSSAGNILEDMDRFQQELDELRAKYQHAA